MVFDAVGGDVTQRSVGVLREGGVLATIRGRELPSAPGIRVFWLLVGPDGTGLERLAALVAEGALRVEVAADGAAGAGGQAARARRDGSYDGEAGRDG